MTAASRPLMQRTIGDLEIMFSNSPADTTLLAQLAAELKHRNVPRAQALDQKVRKALDTADTTKQNLSADERDESVVRPKTILARARAKQANGNQAELWREASTANTLSGPSGETREVSIPKRTSDAPSPGKKSHTSDDHSMSVEEAYRILTAKPDSTWEALEMKRRQIVQLSSPSHTKHLSSGERSKLLSNARQVNQAYMALCLARGRNGS